VASAADNCYTDMGKDAQWTSDSPQEPVLNICRLLMLQPSKSAFAIASAFLLSLLFFLQLPWNPDLATPNTMDDFFGADTWRVLENLKDSDLVAHHRDRVHPYFSLLAVSFAKLASNLPIQDPEFIVYRTTFGTLGAFLFWLFLYRARGAMVAFGSLFLLLSTTTVHIWSILPETFIFGFFTLILSLQLAALRVTPVIVLITSLSGTITNSVFGLLYFVKQRPSLFVLIRQLLIGATVLWLMSLAQKSLYPTSEHFFDWPALKREREFLLRDFNEIPLRLFDFLFSGFVLPFTVTSEVNLSSLEMWRRFFSSPVADYGVRCWLGVILSIGFISLLYGYSCLRFFKSTHRDGLLTVVLLFALAQGALHIAYGDMPFLYSYHFIPFLIIFMVHVLPNSRATLIALTVLSLILREANFASGKFSTIFG
jgi:hypothetical protein